MEILVTINRGYNIHKKRMVKSAVVERVYGEWVRLKYPIAKKKVVHISSCSTEEGHPLDKRSYDKEDEITRLKARLHIAEQTIKDLREKS